MMMKKIIPLRKVIRILLLGVCYLTAFIIQSGEVWAQQLDTKNLKQVSSKSSVFLKSFDDSVRESRVEMRKYCAITRKLMEKPDSEKMELALKAIRKARTLWEKVQKKYQENPPMEYQKDNLFKSRLTEIHGKMEEMENELLKNSPRKSFKACAYACGLFVKMHEENGLVYIADRLYHLRKFGKTMKAAISTKGLPAAQEMLPELLHQRDRVLLTAHLGFNKPKKQKEFQSTLRSMSASVDSVALATTKKNIPGLKSALNDLISQINKAYALAL